MTFEAKAAASLALVAGRRAKIYLADNSRFRSNACEQRAFVERFCDRCGLAAEWPSEHVFFPTSLTIEQRQEVGPPIDDPAPGPALRKAWRLIGKCDAVVAEISAFRGLHMNALVAFEVGIAVVHDIPVFAWTKDCAGGKALTMRERLRTQDKISPDGNWRDHEGGLVENFGLVEFAAIAGNFVSVSTSRIAAIRVAAAHIRA